jgi:hypothetical protein
LVFLIIGMDVELAVARRTVDFLSGVALRDDGNALAMEALSGSCEFLVLEHLD